MPRLDETGLIRLVNDLKAKLVAKTQTINSKPLSGNITLTAADVGAVSTTGKAYDSDRLDGQDSTYYAVKADTQTALDGKQATITTTGTGNLLTAPASAGGNPGAVAQTTFAPRAGGFTFTGAVGASNAAAAGSEYVRNIIISPTDLTAGASPLETNVIYVVYE